MTIRTTTLGLTLFLLSAIGYSQPGTIDSLKRQLAKSLLPEEQLEIELQLAENYRTHEPDSSFHYASKALTIAKQQGDQIKIIRGEFYQASYDYMMGKPEDALALAEKNIALVQKKPGELSLLAQYTSFTGLCFMKLNEIKQALERFYIALKLAEQANDYMAQARAKVNIGWAMMELNQYDHAVISLKSALTLMDEKKITSAYNGTIYSNLAASYGALNQLDSSLKYSRIAILEAHRDQNITVEANGLFILGTTQAKQGKYSEALQSFLAAKPLREKVG